jgi:serine/threonine protein kinase
MIGRGEAASRSHTGVADRSRSCLSMNFPDNSDNPSPIKEGEVVADKYRVDGVLGIGGMGVVVAATHLALGHRVAIKFLLPDAVRTPAALERFAREARAAARLRSDHAARVLDVGTLANGAPYMVMEFLEGSDLGALVQERGALRIDDAIEYVLQACDAIAEAHALGIVHRDLKPRNLFLTRKTSGAPYVKVLDFGISKLTTITGQDHSLTKTSDVMGSPNYMAPEQIRSSKDVDERTDVWALGVILYELITGRVPFLADTVPQLCALVLEMQPTPLEQLRPETPPELRHVIARCLQKDPAARFSSVTELASVLATLAAQPANASTVRWSSDAPPPAAKLKTTGSSARVLVSGGTSVTWGDTVLGPVKKRGARWVAVAVVATCALGGIAFGVTRWSASRASGASSAPSGAPSLALTTSTTSTTSQSAAELPGAIPTLLPTPMPSEGPIPLTDAGAARARTDAASPAHPPPPASTAPKPSAAPSSTPPTPNPTAPGGGDLLPRERK